MKRKQQNGGDDPERAARRAKGIELRKTAAQLPVAEAQDGVIELIKNNQVVVLIGETGSGKTTQVPQFLLRRLGDSAKTIAVTQPRRIAAVTIARRVSEEMGCKLGGLVGYAVRFDDTSSPQTRIKYMTDGILMRELLSSKDLSRYGVVILDEAHERTVNNDILIGLIKEITTRRSDLRIVVMSATLNAEIFSKYWGNCPIGYIEGRTYPVDVFYTAEPCQDIIDSAVITILQIHVDHPNEDGDILVFLTGQDTIEDATRILQEKIKLIPKGDRELLPIPLYANLTFEKQGRAFVPPPVNCRKVILATNVAETSLTIPNIKFVVDCGLVKEKRYNPVTGMESLTEVQVSQAQAKQRSGRAGRVQSGECYRMFTEHAYLSLNQVTEPEIKRVNLSSVILQLKMLGVDDIMSFSFIEPPKEQNLVAALHLLYLLGALDTKGCVTDVGKKIAKLPIDPTHARTLIAAEEFGVFDSVVSIIAMLSTENVLSSPNKYQRDQVDANRQAFHSPHGDHLTMLNIFNEFKKQSKKDVFDWCRQLLVNYRKMASVLDIRKQLRQFSGYTAADKEQEIADSTSMIRKAFCHGFFLNVAQYDFDKKIYHTAETKQEVSIHPSSCLFRSRQRPPLVLYDEVLFTKKRFMRSIISGM